MSEAAGPRRGMDRAFALKQQTARMLQPLLFQVPHWACAQKLCEVAEHTSFTDAAGARQIH
ncbi:MAG: hypothetical protein AAGC83_07045, partial [Pseudomonadota bacterium]